MRKTIYMLITLLGLACLSTSCNFGNKKTKSDDASQSITIGVMASMDYLPLAVAKREGYFDKYGIEVTIEKFVSANERDIAFRGKAVDGGITDFTSAAILHHAGYDMKITSRCQAPFYMVANGQTDIYAFSDLKGKKVGISQNTVIEYIVDLALDLGGLTEKDVEKVEINKIPLRYEMLIAGKLDATGLPEPFASMAEKEGQRVLRQMDDLEYAFTCIVFSQEAIDNKSEAIKKMYKAYNQGVAYLESHTVEDIKDILTKDLNFPEYILTDFSLPIYTNALPVEEKDREIVEVVKWLKDKQVIDKAIETSSMINTQLTE